MTEREKMLSGELYDPTDKELEQLRLNARKLARKYNSTDEDQPEEHAHTTYNKEGLTREYIHYDENCRIDPVG